MYSADNGGRLPENEPNVPAGRSTNLWVLGNLKSAQDATNQIPLRLGKLYPYTSQPELYHCPADPSRTGGVSRVRSYSMNGWVGSRYMESEYSSTPYRTFIRDNELAAARPARLWVIIDEHEATIDDGWFLVTMDDSRPFASAPATRHNLSYTLNFADGHVETCKLRDPASASLGVQSGQFDPRNSDWLRLKEITTVR